MKVLWYFLLSLISCLNVFAEKPVEYFNVGNTIKYGGTDYSLAWSAHPQANYYIQEYLPKGESSEHYNQMLTVSVFFGDLTPQEAVNAKILELDKRKQNDPVINYMTAENHGEYILEFIVSDGDNGKVHTIEVDVHHYKQMTIDGKQALVLTFYSGRAYGDDIKPYILSIPQKRAAWYEGISVLNIDPKFPK